MLSKHPQANTFDRAEDTHVHGFQQIQLRRGHTLGTGSEDDNLPQYLCYPQSTMPPRHVKSPEHGQELPHPHGGSISGSQDAPGGFTETKESNPWASEPADEWPTKTQQSQHYSIARPRGMTDSIHEAKIRPSRRQTMTQTRQGKANSGPGKPTRSREHRFSRDAPNVKSYGPGDRHSWEADSETSHSSGFRSENSDTFHSNLAHDKLMNQIQRLQKRLASLQHNDSDPDSAGDRSAPAKTP